MMTLNIDEFERQKELAVKQYANVDWEKASSSTKDYWYKQINLKKLKDSWFVDIFNDMKFNAINGEINNKLFNTYFKKFNKEDFIILSPDFELFHKKIDYPRVLYNKKIPFTNIFVDVRFFIEDKGVQYGVCGFFMIKFDEYKVLVFAPVISRGAETKNIMFSAMIDLKIFCNLDTDIKFVKNVDKVKNFFGAEDIDYGEDEFSYKIKDKVSEYIFLLLDLIKTKEYTEYHYYDKGKFKKDNIVYEQDVIGHKHHFWKKSFYRNIYQSSEQELIEKHIHFDRIVYRDGVLYENVPFKFIDTYIKNGETRKENRIIELLKKKQWKNQAKLGLILRQIFPNEHIRSNDRKVIKPLELDFNVIKKNLAFEYDGEQHFNRDVCENIFKSNFDELQHRDRRKEHLCRQKGIKLIRIKFDEPLNLSYIKKKIKICGISL